MSSRSPFPALPRNRQGNRARLAACLFITTMACLIQTMTGCIGRSEASTGTYTMTERTFAPAEVDPAVAGKPTPAGQVVHEKIVTATGPRATGDAIKKFDMGKFRFDGRTGSTLIGGLSISIESAKGNELFIWIGCGAILCGALFLAAKLWVAGGCVMLAGFAIAGMYYYPIIGGIAAGVLILFAAGHLVWVLLAHNGLKVSTTQLVEGFGNAETALREELKAIWDEVPELRQYGHATVAARLLRAMKLNMVAVQDTSTQKRVQKTQRRINVRAAKTRVAQVAQPNS